LLAVRPDVVVTTMATIFDALDYRNEPWFATIATPDTDDAWRARGACRDPAVPTWMFFPGRGDAETSRAAQDICAGCEVREQCLDYALTTDALGIWGGKTEQQRQCMLGRRGGLEQTA
jgi:WhiB family transcriptional regulator, redox-sensing transcriptional regulator